MNKVAAAVVFALAGFAPVGAQSPDQTATISLTLEDAIRRGTESSHRVEELTARGAAADAVAEQRRAVQLPQLSAEAGYMRTNHVDEFGVPIVGNEIKPIYPDVPDNYRTGLRAQWPLYTGGRAQALERAALSEATAMSKDLAALRTDLRLQITRAYWGLITATESLRVVEDTLTRTRAHLQDMRNRLAAGLVPPNEVLTVEAQESQQRILRIRAQVTRDVTEAELVRLIGASPGSRIRPVSSLDPPTAAASVLEALVERARAQRSDRAAILERLVVADERKAAAAAGSRPTVALSGGVDYARPNARIFPRAAEWKPSWDASINVGWSLIDGGRTRAEVAEAAAARRALSARLDEFDSLLVVELQSRASELQASIAAIAAAEDSVRAATEARRVVGERFEAGVATSTEVLDAEGDVLVAELSRTRAIANARIAEAQLIRAVGE
jgi:outer membrane protein TolC